jgi:hypothetical protein
MIDTSWLDDPLDTISAPAPTPTAKIMQRGAQEGKDRIWWGDGAHDTKQAGAILPESLEWLWR